MKIVKNILLIAALGMTTSYAQEITVPNCFTPNGDDINDVYKVETTGFDNLTVTIMNRQGQIVYRYYGINGFWDGYTHAGQKVSAGTYWVIVEASTSDGSTETRQGIIYVNY